MSYRIYFSFSSGLNGPLSVLSGTLDNILEHVRHIEATLGFKTEKHKDNPPHWKSTTPKKGISDELLCKEAEEHNKWVRELYQDFTEWSEHPVIDGETITPEDAQKFWQALQKIQVPPERWTADYYEERMTAIYEAMRGRYDEGVTFDAKPLTIKQAAAVIRMFEQFLDTHDVRLDVPKGHDSLYNGDEMAWCPKCGPIHWDDMRAEARNCKRRGSCLLKEEYSLGEEEEE